MRNSLLFIYYSGKIRRKLQPLRLSTILLYAKKVRLSIGFVKNLQNIIIFIIIKVIFLIEKFKNVGVEFHYKVDKGFYIYYNI